MRSISPPSEAMQAAALRRSGSLRALVPLAAGALLFWLGRPIASSIAVGLGALTLVLALVSPTRGYLALSRAIARLGEGVGLVLSWLLLGPVFFLFFVVKFPRLHAIREIGKIPERSPRTLDLIPLVLPPCTPRPPC